MRRPGAAVGVGLLVDLLARAVGAHRARAVRSSRRVADAALQRVTPILGMANQGAVRHYVGLHRVEALQLAEREDREVVDRSPHFGRRRSHHVANHVSVRLDVDDDDTDDGPVAREQEAVSH